MPSQKDATFGSEFKLGGVGVALASYTLPPVPNLGMFENKHLDYDLSKKIIDILGDYKNSLGGVREDFLNYRRIATNFINHVIKELKNYRSIITSCVRSMDSKNFGNYRAKFKASLEKIKADCKNNDIVNCNYKTYHTNMTTLKVRFSSTSGYLIGDFALDLCECAGKTMEELELDKQVPDKQVPDTFIKFLYGDKKISKPGVFKQILKEKVGHINNPFSFVSGIKKAVSKTVSSVMESAGGGLVAALQLHPVEYYKFDENGCLSISVVHSVEYILKNYSQTIKDYPSELRVYVEICKKYTKILLGYLEKYESYLRMFSKSSVSFDQKVKTRSNINILLGKMVSLIEGVKKEKVIEYMLSKGPSGYGGYETGFRRNHLESDKPYLIDGWTFGHFLKEFKEKCVQKTKNNLNELIKLNLKGDEINYEALKIKNPNGSKSGKSSSEISTPKQEDVTPTPEGPTPVDEKKLEKEKSKALKYYIDALGKAKDIYVDADSAREKAQKIVKILVDNKDCTDAYNRCYGGEAFEREKISYETFEGSGIFENIEKFTNKKEKDVDNIIKSKEGFLKLQALYQFFQLQRYGDGKDDYCFAIDYALKGNKHVVNKVNAKKVIDWQFLQNKSDEFLQDIISKLQDFKLLGKGVKKDFDNFVKLYKRAANDKEKEINKKEKKK